MRKLSLIMLMFALFGFGCGEEETKPPADTSETSDQDQSPDLQPDIPLDETPDEEDGRDLPPDAPDVPPDELPDVPPDVQPDVPPDEIPDVPPDEIPDVPPDEEPDQVEPLEQWLGAPCQCESVPGNDCDQMGVPLPNGGQKNGCDNVPDSWTGADKVCLRSYGGSLANKTYFANGYCSLMATSCSGSELICGSAVMGSYEQMVACPAGGVLVSGSQAVSVFGQNATVQNKTCANPCETSDDCRSNETDPALQNQPTQYQCIDKDGVKFCYDPRNLSGEYTATQF
ncbi:MAG: hypothetical protein RBU37_08640 [Myxococcota bacterium]|jgi:hypothetical protein|nr:hypothetical protein [Myxococcota bacterium]